MKKSATFLLIFIILFTKFTAVSANIDKVIAPTYYLISSDSGGVLAEKNCSGTVKPGDFSKIMTALLAIEKFKPNDFLSFKQSPLNFYNSFGNLINAKTGLKITVKEHLYNMMLLYSDASATELAVAHSGSVETFTQEMNKKAKHIGMKNTVFSSPSGYDPASVSKTTVYDLAVLAQYAMKVPLFSEIVSTDIFNITENGETNKYSSRNHLISKYTYSDYTYQAAAGIMPCFFEDNANYIAYATKNSVSLIAIVINSPNDSSMSVYKDVINLLNYGYNNFYPRLICREGEIVDQIKVIGGTQSSVTLQCDSSVKALLPLGYDENLLTYKTDISTDKLRAPVKKGQVLGTVTYSYNGKFLANVPLVAEKNIKFSIFGLIHDKIFGNFNTTFLLVVVLLAFVYVLLSSREKKKKAERLKKRKSIIDNIDQQRRNSK